MGIGSVILVLLVVGLWAGIKSASNPQPQPAVQPPCPTGPSGYSSRGCASRYEVARPGPKGRSWPVSPRMEVRDIRGMVFSDATPVLLVGVPRDLEEMTIGIGEVPGVDAEGAHMSGGGQRASGGFDLPEQLVDLCL
jgi:hypothetical protein